MKSNAKNLPKSLQEVSEASFWTDFGDFPDAPKSVFEVTRGHFWRFLTKKAAPMHFGAAV